jgi:hypothetical protein
MTEMYKWMDTGQIREAQRAIQQKAQFVRVEEDGSITMDRNAKLPILTYRGTVKAHGSNASFVYDLNTDTFQFQSRERILSLDSDNANFMLEMSGKIDILKKIIDQYLDGATPEKIAVYGEFCAGNIQKGVAITGLPKMFLIFGVKLINGEESSWVPLNVNFDSPENGIYSILKFQTFEKTIDFSDAQKVAKTQNEIVELTTKVGDECPIGKYFGVTGIGEGIVWTCQTKGWQSSKFVFKSKDDRHSVSKVKTLKVVDTGRLGTIMQLANDVTPGWRLDQGIEAACDLMNGGTMSMEKIGAFLKWVNTDIVKEESPRFVDAQIPMKEVFPYISKIGRGYFIERFNKEGV